MVAPPEISMKDGRNGRYRKPQAARRRDCGRRIWPQRVLFSVRPRKSSPGAARTQSIVTKHPAADHRQRGRAPCCCCWPPFIPGCVLGSTCTGFRTRLRPTAPSRGGAPLASAARVKHHVVPGSRCQRIHPRLFHHRIAKAHPCAGKMLHTEANEKSGYQTNDWRPD